MTGLGLALLAIGLGDLASGGVSGRPESAGRAWLGVLVSVAVTAACGGVVGWGLHHIVALTALVAVVSVTWTWARRLADVADGGARRTWLAVAAGSLAVGGVTSLLMSSGWPDPSVPWLDALLLRLAEDGLFVVAGTRQVVMLSGSLVALTATANACVRLVLDAAGTEMPPQDGGRLDGGRYIGVLERWLIYGLALAGEPTAAALVVSAKSILRFPEVSRKVSDVTDVTEYFVLGSLASWTLALGATLFV